MILEKIKRLFTHSDAAGGKTECSIYKGTPGIRQLEKTHIPKDFLSRVFPSEQWPISGGWGYSKDDSVVVEIDNEFDGVDFEYKFLKYRSYLECTVVPPEGMKVNITDLQRGRQSLFHTDDGKHYDVVQMRVVYLLHDDFVALKNDWEEHNEYANDEEGRKRHLELYNQKQLTYDIVGHFDISRFFGKTNFK